MTVCDVCGKPATQFAEVKIDRKAMRDCEEGRFDLCDGCAAHAGSNAFRVGIQTLAGQKTAESHPAPAAPERTAFTRVLTELCRQHGVGIEGGRLWRLDDTWTGPDADIHAEYVVDADGNLVRTLGTT